MKKKWKMDVFTDREYGCMTFKKLAQTAQYTFYIEQFLSLQNVCAYLTLKFNQFNLMRPFHVFKDIFLLTKKFLHIAILLLLL